jgi:hypothetical protein
VARQVPPFRHGFGLHGLGTVVVVVVAPAVHTDEPGGADVPGGHAVHDVAAPAENVSAGHWMQDDEPVKGVYVPDGHGSHAIAPLSVENVPGEHGVHEVAPTVSENVPGKHIRHGSMPVPLELPGWQGCARADELTNRVAQSARRIDFIRVPKAMDYDVGCPHVNRKSCAARAEVIAERASLAAASRVGAADDRGRLFF